MKDNPPGAARDSGQPGRRGPVWSGCLQRAVLVVDDDAATREGLKELLAQIDHLSHAAGALEIRHAERSGGRKRQDLVDPRRSAAKQRRRAETVMSRPELLDGDSTHHAHRGDYQHAGN